MSERAKARAVVEEALSGELSIDDFHRRWPESEDPLLGVVFEETEDTVEHVPGSWFDRGPHRRFGDSVPYKVLIVDSQFLKDDFIDVSGERLVEIRKRLQAEVDLREGDERLAELAHKFVSREIAEPSI